MLSLCLYIGSCIVPIQDAECYRIMKYSCVCMYICVSCMYVCACTVHNMYMMMCVQVAICVMSVYNEFIGSYACQYVCVVTLLYMYYCKNV